MKPISPRVHKSESPVCGIYAIVNLVNGRKYVGSSVRVAHRWRDHIWELSEQKHLNPLLQNAWNKYGREAFACYLLEEVKPEHLTAREQFHIEQNTGGYNLCADAGRPPVRTPRGRTVSAETRRRISEKNKGRKLSEETRQKMRDGQLRRNAAIRAATNATGPRRKPPPEHIPGWSQLTRGQKISIRKTGLKMAPEHVEQNRLARLGKTLTPEWRTRIGAGVKAFHQRRKAMARERALFTYERD